MTNEIKLKSGVYAVVNVDTGDVLALSAERGLARAHLQHVKSQSDNPRILKLFKMKPEKVIR